MSDGDEMAKYNLDNYDEEESRGVGAWNRLEAFHRNQLTFISQRWAHSPTFVALLFTETTTKIPTST